MKISVQRKSISGERTQLQLSYTVNGKRRQVVVPGATYANGASKADIKRAEATAEEAARILAEQLGGMSVTAAVLRHAQAQGISDTKRTQLKRVAELWEQCGGATEPLPKLNPSEIARFAEFLETKYSANTRRSYIAQLLWCISQERKSGAVSYDQADRLTAAAEKPRAEKDNRPYIEPKDIERLFDTPLPSATSKLVADAFMLSFYTGLRYSDIRTLKADNVSGDCIRLSMQKTASTLAVPINGKARRIIERNEPKLFAELPPQTTKANRELAAWAKAANVEATHPDGTKSAPTFHAARHSCATMLLNKGVAIEQVSALLGHKSISTTQVYAKIINKTLAAAVALL